MALPDRPWALWRWVGLRGAGFPAENVLALAAPDAAATADDLLAAEADVQESLTLAQAAVHQALDELRSTGGWEDTSRREPLLKIMRGLKKGRLPALDDGGVTLPGLDTLQRVMEHRETAQSAFDRAFADGVRQVSEGVRQVASQPLFREAVIWQNRQALHSGLLTLLDRPESAQRSKKQRQQEELVANYLQRYCVKNDTIGFFGPVGWARWVDVPQQIVRAEPGAGLLRKRTVYFEGWGIDALAQTISQDLSLRPWMTPRRLPYFHLEGSVLLTPSRPPMPLAPRTAAVLHACDGQRTARQLAQALLPAGITGLQSESDVFAVLEELLRNKLIVWTFEVPLEVFPERRLRQALERIEEVAPRQAALAALDELEAARDGVTAAVGDAAALDKALNHLEDTFSRLTTVAPTRSHGQTYSGRTLVYEDCLRNFDMELGQELLAALAPPLSLLLTSARWLAFQVANHVRNTLRTLYSENRSRTGQATISAMGFAAQAQPHLFGPGAEAFDAIRLNYQQKWAAALTMPVRTRCVHYDSRSLQSVIMTAFQAPDSGWEYARYHSPDIMIAADSLTAIQQGDYQLVLGEIHPALNTLGAAFWLAQHPSADDLFEAMASDLPGVHLTYAIPKSWPSMTTRTHRALLPPQNFHLAFGNDPVAAPSSQILPIGSLVVEEVDGQLIIRSRDGRAQFDFLEAFTPTLIRLLGGLSDPFGLVGQTDYTPRIMIDNLVVARETWRVRVEAASFAYVKDEGERFLEARRWARELGIPRLAFGRVSIERKPFFVDFDSPIYVNILAKMIRRTAENKEADPTLTIREMLPRPDQTWLTDAQGRRYTCELRLVALDLTNRPATS